MVIFQIAKLVYELATMQCALEAGLVILVTALYYINYHPHSQKEVCTFS